jgi:hypothetical protein
VLTKPIEREALSFLVTADDLGLDGLERNGSIEWNLGAPGYVAMLLPGPGHSSVIIPGACLQEKPSGN